MKEKEAHNVEDLIAQLSNSRKSETSLVSLYDKINSSNLSNVQRTRLLKVIVLHITKDSARPDVCVAALNLGNSLIQADTSSLTHAATGANFSFLEACFKLVKDYVDNSSKVHIDVVEKALEVLSSTNAATASKLFYEKSGATFVTILKTCLKIDKLALHSLGLFNIGLTVQESQVPRKAIFEDATNSYMLIELTYPLLFNLNSAEVRAAALSVMKQLAGVPKSQSLWNKLREETQKVHCKQMVDMVNQKMNWPEIWEFVVTMFGEELHSGGQLINHMLEILEKAFKHADFEWTRVKAFTCWNILIDNFKNGLKNKKRIDLIMIPLKAHNHRIEILASAKLNTYKHLFKTLGKDLNSYPDVLLCFLSFCFGSQKLTCPPLKFYSNLHEECVTTISHILQQPFINDVFSKLFKEVINSVCDCFLMECASSESLMKLWNSLMSLVQNLEGTDAVKVLLGKVDGLVTQASDGELGLNVKSCSATSPLSPKPAQSNESLGKKIVSIILHGLVRGNHCLKVSVLRSRALYTGAFDLMNGTPSLLIVEWLLSPALMSGYDTSADLLEILSEVISVRREDLMGFMDFVQQIVKKLLVVEDGLPSGKKKSFLKYATDVWCTVAEELLKFMLNEGSVDQGDAAGHDLKAFYTVLLYPVQTLYVDFDFVEKCGLHWANLFYQACQQIALHPSSSVQRLCEELCMRLVMVWKANSTSKQQSAVFFYLSRILNVACGRFQSIKRLQWVQEHISSILKELHDTSFDEEVLGQAAQCINLCLYPNTATKEIVSNVIPTLVKLLNVKIGNSCDSADKLCTALSALKGALLTIHQKGCPKESVKNILQTCIMSSRNHTNAKIKNAIKELSEMFEEKKTPQKDSRTVNGNAMSPSNRLSSPKSITKKLTTIQMSPSNLASGSCKRTFQATVCGSDGKFVRIETPPKKIILTEHQKEVRRERRQDIPALYQDLSQNTESMSQDISQDCAPLPPSPEKNRGLVLDENAVMDTDEVEAPIKVVSMQIKESPRTDKITHLSKGSNGELKGFNPPSGFVLSTENGETNGKVGSNEEQSRPGKENEDEKVSQAEKNTPTTRRAVTRSSASTTRSGKIVKRLSLALEQETLKRKSVRKSLPATPSEEREQKAAPEDNGSDTVSLSNGSHAGPHGSKQMKSKKRLSKKNPSQEGEASVGMEASASKEEASKAEKLKTNESRLFTCNVPVGGKVLTRSRSNSSLDDVVASGATKKKDGISPKSNNAGLLKDVADAAAIKTNADSSKLNTTYTCIKEVEDEGTSEVEASPMNHQRNKTVKDSNEDLQLELNSAGSSSCKKIGNVSCDAVGPSDVDLTSSNKQSQPTNKTDNERKIPAVELERIPEESQSQDIIESSQEEPVSKIKECIVSLELFSCSEPNGKTELHNLVIEKGPDVRSPYKVRSKTDTEISPTLQKSVCRSLKLDSTETENSTSGYEKGETVQRNSSPLKATPVSEDTKEVQSTAVQNTDTNELNKPDPPDTQEPAAELYSNPRVDSMPDWMHEKKVSPNKPPRIIRNASSRSQAFMKSVDFSGSPPKGIVDMSPLSSPVQAKRIQKTDSSSNTTPIIKRSSRAAQLLGLGQAAAARGGETVVCNPNRLSLKVDENEIDIAAPLSAAIGNSSTNSAITSLSTVTMTSSIVMASPSIRRQGRVLDMDSQKSTPQKSIEDKGLKEDWVPKTPCAKATPDSSILKRKREADSDVPSPSLKRKRVSFRDPPLSSMLRFAESSEAPGTVFSSDHSNNAEKGIVIQSLENEVEGSRSSSFSKESMKDSCNSMDQMDSQSDNSDDRTSTGDTVPKVNVTSPDDSQVETNDSKNKSPEIMGNDPSASSECESNEVGNEEMSCKSSSNNPETVEVSLLESGSEQVDMETQGMLDDLHQSPPSILPVFPNLVKCSHSVELIALKLTTSIWKTSLLKEFAEQEVHTIGDLAKLTEERVDRLSVKPPKRSNVYCVLEDFEKSHRDLKDASGCELSNPLSAPCHKEVTSLKDILSSVSDEDILSTLVELKRLPRVSAMMIKAADPQDVAAAVSSEKTVLQALPVDLVAETYLKMEKTLTREGLSLILSRVPSQVIQDTLFPSKPSLLSSVLSDGISECVLRQCSPSEIVEQVDDAYKLLEPLVGKLGVEQISSQILPNLNPALIAQHIDDEIKIEGTVKALLSKLDHRRALQFLFEFGQGIVKNKDL